MMVRIQNIRILLVCIVTFGCQSNKRDIALEQSLKFADENKIELIKVLNHVKLDSLKLEAAKFLIRNMPFHYYYENNTLEKYYADFYNTVTNYDISIGEVADSLEGVYGKMRLSNHTIYNDAKSIKAGYLIENIDHAFMAWENSPWGNDVDFSEFCREILPYRIGNEPVEKWREPYYRKFKPILDSLLTKEDPVTACQVLYDAVINQNWFFVPDQGLPHRSALFLLDKINRSMFVDECFSVQMQRGKEVYGHTLCCIDNDMFLLFLYSSKIGIMISSLYRI